MKTTVSTKGQFMLPAEIRQRDNIEPGQEFEVERIDRGEYQSPAPRAPSPMRGSSIGYWRARKKVISLLSNPSRPIRCDLSNDTLRCASWPDWQKSRRFEWKRRAILSRPTVLHAIQKTMPSIASPNNYLPG